MPSGDWSEALPAILTLSLKLVTAQMPVPTFYSLLSPAASDRVPNLTHRRGHSAIFATDLRVTQHQRGLQTARASAYLGLFR